ncbi:hypothetical protein AMATHDRAFT_47382 [Amanita thiersii Skay4041]|uniref:Uncharacterized protein n=1 Tax=Amanita thiersii Skay4041 TaxID=703135 RepID=A0A2A9NKL3_9AGAR|nr:hypothetical protein AMATHDRAFT_47382 [Amanita thiersii Skay4041]
MALFAFSIIFTTFYFYLLVRAILSLTATRAKKEDFPFRKPFTTLMLFSALSLLVTNTLGIVRHHHGTSGTPRAVFVLLVFTSDLATVIIYAGLVLLVLVAYRGLGKPIAMRPATGRGWERREGLCTKLTTLLLFTMLSASIVRMVIFAAGQNMSQERRRMVFNALYFVFLGVWCALTGIVTGTSVLLWINRPSRSYSTTSDLDVSWNSLAGLGVDFENNVSVHVVFWGAYTYPAGFFSGPIQTYDTDMSRFDHTHIVRDFIRDNYLL